MANEKYIARKRRHNRVRSKISGEEKRPRLVVFRSLKNIYAQLVDDKNGKVIAGTSDIKESKGTKTERGKKVGIEIAKLAKEKKIETVVFDRNGYKYHGRVKALAEGAREGGLKF